MYRYRYVHTRMADCNGFAIYKSKDNETKTVTYDVKPMGNKYLPVGVKSQFNTLMEARKCARKW